MWPWGVEPWISVRAAFCLMEGYKCFEQLWSAAASMTNGGSCGLATFGGPQVLLYLYFLSPWGLATIDRIPPLTIHDTGNEDINWRADVALNHSVVAGNDLWSKTASWRSKGEEQEWFKRVCTWLFWSGKWPIHHLHPKIYSFHRLVPSRQKPSRRNLDFLLPAEEASHPSDLLMFGYK